VTDPARARQAEPDFDRERFLNLAGLIAGALGAAMALAFGELFNDISDPIPSLVIAVGEVITDYTPGDVVAFSIANVGASQKTVLTIGITIGTLIAGALLGRAAVRGRLRFAIGGFAAFGLIGGWAAARNPLSPALSSWAVALGAAVLAMVTTLVLVNRASRAPRQAAAATADNTEPEESSEDRDEESRRMLARSGPRRSFFGYSGGAAVTALALLGLGRSLREPSAAQKAREIYTLPPRASAPEASAGTVEAPTGAAVEVPEGIEIPEGIEVPNNVEIPEGIEVPNNVEVPEASITPDTAIAQEPPSTTVGNAQQPEQSTASTTTQAPEEPDAVPSDQVSDEFDELTPQASTEPPASTTTQAPEQNPSTTTTQAPTEPPATSTTQAPEEPSTTTTTTTTTTTAAPQRSFSHPQVANLDTLDDEVPGIAPYVTPISPKNEFYRIDTALTVPQVDPDQWRLRITGLVDNPYELTYQEIRAMSLSDHVITLSCVSNQVGGDLVGNAIWTGIPLNVLLQRAGVQRGAQQIVGRSVDDFTAGFPTTAAYDGRNAILAIGMNNEPLPLRHGFPARIVVAGLYGYVSAVKWIEEIRLATWEGFDGYWVPRGWSKQGPVKTQSRIDVPANDSNVKVGETVAIAGVAWAPTRGIRQVEVSVGEGNWMPCRLGEVAGNESWAQWHLAWTPATSGRQRIQVRATDGGGITQSSNNVNPRPNGAEGWHTIRVNVRA